MRILYYISFKYVVFLFFLRCLRNLKKWSWVEKIGKNWEKWGKMAVPESPNIHYFYLSHENPPNVFKLCLSFLNYFSCHPTVYLD